VYKRKVFNSYSEAERREALQLSADIGIKAASAKTEIPESTLWLWLKMTEKYGQPTKPPEQQKPFEPATNKLIEAVIAEAIKSTPEHLTCWYGVFYGIPGTITTEARELLRERLRAFPGVCLQAREVDGTMKIVLDYEIKTIKNALTDISGDPFYHVVPDLYFHRLDRREVSYRQNCNIEALKFHEKRLIDKMAFLIYGVQSWWRAIPPATM
jgi:transposase-like protein